MKLINPYLFGLVFLSAFAYLVYNSFQLPKFFFEETEETEGVVLDVRLHQLRHGVSQNVTYAFRCSDTLIIGNRVVKSNRGQKYTGVKFRLKYQSSDLSYFEIIHFYKPNFTFEEVKYLSEVSNGYSEILFKNEIFIKRDFKKGEELNTTIYGEYKWQNDTLMVYELLSELRQENIIMKLVEISSQDGYFRLKNINSNGQTYFSLVSIKNEMKQIK